MILNFIKQISNDGINLIDIGSSGSLDAKWTPIKDLINLVGFDPNQEECERQNKLPSQYKRSTFLPYAVHGKDSVETLYKTKSIYCYSLLEPNKQWLDRFSFHDLFDVEGEESIPVRAIDKIDELKSFSPDVIKIDVQGLELPILSKAGHLLKDAFYVETESGFTENYVGETTFHQMDRFMQENGFLMFDINVNHRISRNNIFKEHSTGKEQILWAEAVWLKDYVGLDRKGEFDPKEFDEQKIKKILVLCALQGCHDFGYELAAFFHKKGLLSKQCLDGFGSSASWSLLPVSEARLNNESSESDAGLAPIVLFAFNRPEHLRKTIESLKANPLAEESELYIFADGVRSESDQANVNAVRAILDSVDGFRKITRTYKSTNDGLAKSVIDGVSEVIGKHERAIIIEDDLQFSPHFLNYMNEALVRYKDDTKIYSIGGYSPALVMPEGYTEDSYLSYRCCTWGWATWADRWNKVDWEIKDFNEFINDSEAVKRFNRGGDDMSQIFELQMAGKVNSWGIRWDYAQFKNDAYCFRPAYGIVGNTGNDGSGVHCAPTEKFDVPLNLQSSFAFPESGQLQVNEEINKRFATFYDGRDRSGSVNVAVISRSFAGRVKRWLIRHLR